MPDARLQRMRENYQCASCGENLLIGVNHRARDYAPIGESHDPRRIYLCLNTTTLGMRLSMTSALQHGEA